MSTSPRSPLSTITNKDPKSARWLTHRDAIEKIQRDHSEMKEATSGNTADMIEIKNAIAQSIALEKKTEEEDVKAKAVHQIELAKQNEVNDERIRGLEKSKADMTEKSNARFYSLAMRIAAAAASSRRFDTHMDAFAKARKNLNTKISAVNNQTDALEIKQGVDHSKFAAIASIISE